MNSGRLSYTPHSKYRGGGRNPPLLPYGSEPVRLHGVVADTRRKAEMVIFLRILRLMSKHPPLPKNDSPYGRRWGYFSGPDPGARRLGFLDSDTSFVFFLGKCIFIGAQPDWRCRPARNSFYAESLIGVFFLLLCEPMERRRIFSAAFPHESMGPTLSHAP